MPVSATDPSPCLITVLIAGTNKPSNSALLADTFIDGMQEAGDIRIEKIRMEDLSLAHFTIERYHPSRLPPEEDYLRIEDVLQKSAGIVFASPVWNFSVPAHFKNLIDRMGSFALDSETHSQGQFKGKPVALLYTGGAPMIAWKALMYLTTLHVAEAMKYYGATVIFRHFEPKCVPGKGRFGLVVDARPKTLRSLRRAGGSFARSTLFYAKHGRLPALQQWIHRWFSFLYRVGNRIMYPIGAQQ